MQLCRRDDRVHRLRSSEDTIPEDSHRRQVSAVYRADDEVCYIAVCLIKVINEHEQCSRSEGSGCIPRRRKPLQKVLRNAALLVSVVSSVSSPEEKPSIFFPCEREHLS